MKNLHILDMSNIFVSNFDKMEKLPNDTVFYIIEKTIKEYRRFAQHTVKKKVKNITIDQALILLFISRQPNLTQTEIGNIIFKDNASVTRMIELLIKNNYLIRKMSSIDRRKFSLSLTKKGNSVEKELESIVLSNRNIALSEVSEQEIKQLIETLGKITSNLKK